jgi:hypothetical protein
MPKVYVPQIPSRMDAGSGVWVPTVNISPAKKFGKIVELLPPEANRLHVVPLLTVLREKMKHYTGDDMIIAVGDPSIIAFTACIAARATGGKLRLLKWDRQTSDYILVEGTI